MHTRIYTHNILLLLSSIFPLLLLSCGSNRVNIEFKTPRDLYVNDAKTDPDRLNRELEYDMREAEKKRIQKLRAAAEAEAKAKAEAEQKGKTNQTKEGEITGEETTQSSETEQPAPQ